MRIRKSDVEEFIKKVENKATQSIESKYRELIGAEIDRMIETNPSLKSAIEVAQTSMDLLHASLTEIKKSVSNMGSSIQYGDTYNAGVSDLLSNISIYKGVGEDGKSVYVPKSIRDKAFYRIIPNTTETLKLVRERQAEVDEVKKAYKALEANVSALSPKKAVEYLKNVGFDVDYFDHIEATTKLIEVDPSKLFVCGENK